MKTKKIPPELEELLEEGIIDDVLARLLSGKEASLFVVQKGEDVIAAKVYKSRKQRSFKNIVSYIDGRNQTRNSRDRRAQSKKTNYGRELVENSWRQMEFDSLFKAFDAGVRCPEPILLSGDVLLMELLMDEFGEPALRLADMEIDDTVAGLLHQEIFQQVRLLLTCDLIHADLSAYNILMAHDGLNLIDLPQAVDASANNEAREILTRDLRNVTEFLGRFDPKLLDYTECGNALFSHYEKGTLSAAVEPQKNPKRTANKVSSRSIDESLYAIREAKEHNDRKHGRGLRQDNDYSVGAPKRESSRGDYGHGERDEQRRHNRDQRSERNSNRDHRGRLDRGEYNRGPRNDSRGEYNRNDNRGSRNDSRGEYNRNDNRGPRNDSRGEYNRNDNRGSRNDSRGEYNRNDNRGSRNDSRGEYNRNDNRGPRNDSRGEYNRNDNRGPRNDSRGEYNRNDNRGSRNDSRGEYNRNDNRGSRNDSRGEYNRNDNRGSRNDSRGEYNRNDNRGPRNDSRGEYNRNDNRGPRNDSRGEYNRNDNRGPRNDSRGEYNRGPRNDHHGESKDSRERPRRNRPPRNSR